MKRNKSSRAVFAVAPLCAALMAALALSGCETERIVLQEGQQASQSQTHEGFTVELSYLDEETLIARHGERNNPFISPEGLVAKNRILVFELRARYEGAGSDAPAPLTLTLKRAEIQFGGKASRPTNRFHLAGFWEPRIENYDAYRYWDRSRTNNAINRTLVDNDMEITPADGPKGGYIVFAGNFPSYGTATVYVPFFSDKKRIFHNYSFSFEF